MKNFNIITAKHIWSKRQDNIMVKLSSYRLKESIIIPYDNDVASGNPALETAVKYLESKGFDIVGKSEDKEHYLIITNTFQSIK